MHWPVHALQWAWVATGRAWRCDRFRLHHKRNLHVTQRLKETEKEWQRQGGRENVEESVRAMPSECLSADEWGREDGRDDGSEGHRDGVSGWCLMGGTQWVIPCLRDGWIEGGRTGAGTVAGIGVDEARVSWNVWWWKRERERERERERKCVLLCDREREGGSENAWVTLTEREKERAM